MFSKRAQQPPVNLLSMKQPVHCLKECNRRTRLSGLFALTTALSILAAINVFISADGIGENLRTEGRIGCLHFNGAFWLSCSFNWTDHFADDGYILLKAGDVFDGNDHKIDLEGIPNWHGLFQIDEEIAKWEDVPVVKHLHMTNGQTSADGGFIIQAHQNNFVVDSCSSSGIINVNSGGICGNECSGTILISNCWSNGLIQGRYAGGIAGRRVGHNGTATISHCYSTGDIRGQGSGGICGLSAAYDGGHVTIIKSYSEGKIEGLRGGGICGAYTAGQAGKVTISQCYTVGEMASWGTGGITGEGTAEFNGSIEISDSYTLGDITAGGHSAGICPFNTGNSGGTVVLKNVYTNGTAGHDDAAGLIGQIPNSAKQVNITMSVYRIEPMIQVYDQSNIGLVQHNSNDMNVIRGQVYCHMDECWDTQVIWKVVPGDVPILQAQLTPSPTPTSASQTPTPTFSVTGTMTGSVTQTSSSTPSPTESPTNTLTQSPSESPSKTQTPNQTPSPTESVTNSPTNTRTQTASASPTRPEPERHFELMELPVQWPRRSIIFRPSPNPTSR